MTISTDPHEGPITLDMSGDPYPFFEYKRKTKPVWRGTVMDHSKAPPELIPAEEWTLFDFDSVFQGFRNDDVFSSHGYDQTIGLVLGPTILAMHGKQHHDHRSLVSKAFRAHSLERWEPEVIDPICDKLVDEIKNDGAADLVRAVTFEFPTRVIAALLGLAGLWALCASPGSPQVVSAYAKDNGFMGSVLVLEGDTVLLNKGFGRRTDAVEMP